MNWAFQKEQKEEVANHFHVFVGDLSSGGLPLPVPPLAPRASESVLQGAGHAAEGGGAVAALIDAPQVPHVAMLILPPVLPPCLCLTQTLPTRCCMPLSPAARGAATRG